MRTNPDQKSLIDFRRCLCYRVFQAFRDLLYIYNLIGTPSLNAIPHVIVPFMLLIFVFENVKPLLYIFMSCSFNGKNHLYLFINTYDSHIAISTLIIIRCKLIIVYFYYIYIYISKK